LGEVDERARVDDDRVGVARLGDQFPPGLAQASDHHLGIDQILRAPEGHERYAI
jgi:hypothetical protein